MSRQQITTTLSAVILCCIFSTNTHAQLFKKAKARRAQRQAMQQQNINASRRSHGQPNLNNHGGIPMYDSVPNRPTIRHRIRDNRILRDGSLQWAPHAVTPNVGYFPAPVYTPPQTQNRSPYAAGPSVGGRIQIRTRPQPQTTQPSGWQPWMHVPLDGSQPWNR